MSQGTSAVKSKGIFNPPVDHHKRKKTNPWIVHKHNELQVRSKLSLVQCPDAVQHQCPAAIKGLNMKTREA